MARPGSPRYFLNLALFSVCAGFAGLLVFTVTTAYRAAAHYTHPNRHPAVATPDRFGLGYQELRLQTDDGLRLAAWYVPSRNRAVLILVHGIGANRGDLLEIARDLAARGYGLLLLDLRAHGESEGQVSTLGVSELHDVRAAVRYLRERPEVDPERIGIYGDSLGAAVAIMAAAELAELKAVVADSGFASVDWLVRHQFNAFVRLPAWLAPLVVGIGSWQAGVDANEIAPVRRIALISPRPILLIHGERDDVFLVQNTLLLAEAARDPKDVWILPNVGHVGAYSSDPRAFIDRVAGFFDRWLLDAGSQGPGAHAYPET